MEQKKDLSEERMKERIDKENGKKIRKMKKE